MMKLAPVLALLIWSCGDTAEVNTLEGSVNRLYDLAFDTVRARKTATELAVQYVSGRSVPVQVVVDLAASELTGPGQYDLTGQSTVVGSVNRQELPAFVNGSVTFSALGLTNGSAVAGHFEANVETDTATYAVRGTFETTLELFE